MSISSFKTNKQKKSLVRHMDFLYYYNSNYMRSFLPSKSDAFLGLIAAAYVLIVNTVPHFVNKNIPYVVNRWQIIFGSPSWCWK